MMIFFCRKNFEKNGLEKEKSILTTKQELLKKQKFQLDEKVNKAKTTKEEKEQEKNVSKHLSHST